MTTGLLATLPVAVGRELHLGLGGTRTMVAALLVALGIALVYSPAMRLDGFVETRPAPTATGPSVAGRDKAEPTRAAPPFAPNARHEVEALATIVARKYRISIAATRAMVVTAYREGQRTGLDPLLILAVIAVESRFNPIAESDAGAQGLMQVIPGYHKDQVEAAHVDSVLDPHANIRLGARILRDYIRRGGTEIAGLQLYNGAASDASNAYATKVLGEKQRLQQAIRHLHA
jgi:soluble lytic murein transglycosylase-like protein